MLAYREIKLFALDQAPASVVRGILAVAASHSGDTDQRAIWEVTVGHVEWTDTPARDRDHERLADAEWALHDWLQDNGAKEGEVVLVTTAVPVASLS